MFCRPKALTARRFRAAKPVSAPFGLRATFKLSLQGHGISRLVLLYVPILWPPGFMIYTGDMQTSRRADQIVKLEKRRQQIAAKARDADKRLADRLRQLQVQEAKTERKRETRRKIVIGAIVRAAQMSRTEISLRWLEAQIHALKRPDDRALFGLDLEPSADAAGADKTEPAGAPITSRQKKLLAKLVEEHPQLARELGVNPDEPGLEELDKAKASFLIQAVLDRVQPAGAAR